MPELPLPPDLERLQAIRAWLDQQQKAHDTIGTFLEVLAATVDAALVDAAPAGPPDSYRIHKTRIPEGRAVLHRDDCWMKGGGVITRDEALVALTDPVVSANLEMCEACRPEDELGAGLP